ncbi:MAG: 2-hydroxychromene-2-carboxylate isomerase [Alphaproteobacteria bacterium]|nr:2-hydroxychromene-2-carboxylate isomerase [Alphaproteobacteria bacterium]
MTTVEFFFDYSSPWTYLAFDRIERVCAEAGAELIWKPFLVGGVFNAVNPSVYKNRENPVPAKDAYYKKDLQDWARYCGIAIGSPSVFPVNSVKAMRGCFLAIEAGRISDYAVAFFKAYWTDDRDISQDEVVADLVAGVGMDPDAFFAGIARQEVKDKLRETTDELIARGGFGSPTFYLDRGDMYFGNDRIEIIADAIRRKKAR